MWVIVGVHRFQRLGYLVEQKGARAGERLLPIPGAAVGCAQVGHHLLQIGIAAVGQGGQVEADAVGNVGLRRKLGQRQRARRAGEIAGRVDELQWVVVRVGITQYVADSQRSRGIGDAEHQRGQPQVKGGDDGGRSGVRHR